MLWRLSKLDPGGWKSDGNPGSGGHVVRMVGGAGGSPDPMTHWKGSVQGKGQKLAGCENKYHFSCNWAG